MEPKIAIVDDFFIPVTEKNGIFSLCNQQQTITVRLSESLYFHHKWSSLKLILSQGGSILSFHDVAIGENQIQYF